MTRATKRYRGPINQTLAHIREFIFQPRRSNSVASFQNHNNSSSGAHKLWNSNFLTSSLSVYFVLRTTCSSTHNFYSFFLRVDAFHNTCFCLSKCRLFRQAACTATTVFEFAVPSDKRDTLDAGRGVVSTGFVVHFNPTCWMYSQWMD